MTKQNFYAHLNRRPELKALYKQEQKALKQKFEKLIQQMQLKKGRPKKIKNNLS